MKTEKNLINSLELINDESALSWVNSQNHITLEKFCNTESFFKRKDIYLKCYNDNSNIPWVTHYGDKVYNFWQDENNPRGKWRRSDEKSYLLGEPEWEIILDLDALNENEQSNLIFNYAQLLYPKFEKALIYLSHGGDACEIREFDLIKKEFIADGFYLPESKSSVSWYDENTLLLSLDYDEESLTSSCYPRCVYKWKRNTSPTESILIYSGEKSDLAVSSWHVFHPGYEKTIICRQIDFYRSCIYILKGGNELKQLEIPHDAYCDFFFQWLIIRLSSSWVIKEKCYLAGSLLVIDTNNFINGEREFSVLFEPQYNVTLQGFSFTRDYIILNLTRDVVGTVNVLKAIDGDWIKFQEIKLPNFTNAWAAGISLESNSFQLISNGFLQPCCLSYGDLDNQSKEIIFRDPDFFDSDSFDVSQHFSNSLDGTRIPYFQIANKELKLTGENATLIYGYGGFEVSLVPEYIGAKGLTWLNEGGVYVVANIRGGGEYGPQWHQAALKKNRNLAYEDFSSIAYDLIRRKVTSKGKLAAQGGSNGGLLIGNMLTDYPDLFSALVCEFPLLDMLNYTKWLVGSSWIAEYGDPNIDEEKEWLKKYSPFHKISCDEKYPAVLFITGTFDDRVSPAHARRMVALMQEKGHKDVWFYEEPNVGHSGAPEKNEIAFKNALVDEFLTYALKKSKLDLDFE
ncbi:MULTISPECIES: prolyl oligopeptidase family serine peptidase [Pantoea]|uniref:prolyl oligopeptidase family serine peptidase n=1 Tax=Pantoea TaxID=53335 RepID=UPI00197E485C|nr:MULTISPECIES: prolyl oligopeptidase family serine peptidase [Pantoea]WRH15757.1 prolyl oligopeptidase family serine peptidase [Pantoea sp. JZ2]